MTSTQPRIEVADNGCLRIFGVHDAYIDGLVITQSKDAIFLLRSVDGHVFCLRLVDVKRFRADDFREGSIVLDITAETGKAVPKSEIIDFLETDGSPRVNNWISDTLRQVRNRELFVVRINPSYGCQLKCLCKNVTLADVSDAISLLNGNT